MSELDYLESFENIFQSNMGLMDRRRISARVNLAKARAIKDENRKKSVAVRLSHNEPSLPRLKFLEGKDE
jgi:hypothetical protein